MAFPIRPAIAALFLTAGCSSSPTTPGGGGGNPPTVSLSATTLALAGLGSDGTLTATSSPAGLPVTWTSENAAVATVSGSGGTGTVHAVAAGSAVIVAAVTSGGQRAEARATVTVTPIARSITIAPTTDTIPVGGARTFTATLAADAGTATTLKWRSSSPTVATVDGSGGATALAAGTTTITVLADADTTIRASATLVVRTPTVRSIAVSGVAATLAEGATAQAAATVVADPGVATAVTWSSTAPAVASVSPTGLVTALTPGSATIVATSTAAPAVTGSVALSVTGPPLFATWTPGRINTGAQFTDGLAQDLVSLGPTKALATYWAFADGASPNYNVLLNNGAVSDVSVPNRTDFAVFALSTADGTNVFGAGGGNNAQAYRWTGSAWALLPGPQPGPLQGTVRALTGDRAVVFTKGGSAPGFHLWNGSGWAPLLAVSALSSTGVSFWPAAPDAIIYSLCQSNSTYTIHSWNGTTTTPVPAMPGTAGNNCPIFFGGAGPNDVYALAGLVKDRVFHWTGPAWTVLSAGLSATETVLSGTLCQGQPVVVTDWGRVYRWSGTAFQRLGTDADNLPERFFASSTRPVACSPDGTLRTAAGDGSISRWTGSTWVVEAFAPSLRAVKLVSPTLGWAAGGAHSVYRWNGSSWALAYRAAEDKIRRVASLTAWPDGRVIGALWSSIAPLAASGGFGPQGILRYDGSQWVRDNGPLLDLVNGVWGPSYGNTFAATGAGAILRFDGSSWSSVFAAGGPLTFIGGAGTDYALAVGLNLRTVRWSGGTWSTVGGLVSAVTPDHFVVAGPNEAWASAGTSLYRFTGSGWSVVDPAPIGGSVFTWSLWATGPGNVYAVRGAGGAARRLYRWNGTQWSQVTGFNPAATDFVEAGSAVGDIAVMVGNAGAVYTSVPSPALRRP